HQRRIGDVDRRGGRSAAAAGVADAHADGVRAFLRVGVRADDVEAAAAVGDDGAGRGRAIAPVDRVGVVAGDAVRIGVGEAGDNATGTRPFRGRERLACGGQGGVGNRGRAAGGRAAAADVVDLYADRVTAFLG